MKYNISIRNIQITDVFITLFLFLFAIYWSTGSENAMIMDYDVITHNGMYIGYQRAFLNSNATVSSLPLSCVIPVEKSRNVLKVLDRAKFEEPFAARVQWTNTNGVCTFVSSNSNFASKCLLFFVIFTFVVGFRQLIRWVKVIGTDHLPLHIHEDEKSL